MTYDRDALRELTLADNMRWLRSFGCTVEHRDDMILVDHAALPEYRAWLFVRETPRAVEQLRRIVSAEAGEPRDVYIDDDVRSAAVLAQATPIARNATVAACLPKRPWRSSIVLQRAAIVDADEWSALYSVGFGRKGQADVDRERWRLSFASADVQQWFFVKNGARIGVCQTTPGPLHGIYSFTLLPKIRGFRNVCQALRALLRQCAVQPSSWIYFEVLNTTPQSRIRLQGVIGLIAVRVMTGYRLSAKET